MDQENQKKNLLGLYEDQDLAGDNVQRANGGCACITALACCDMCTQNPDTCAGCCAC